MKTGDIISKHFKLLVFILAAIIVGSIGIIFAIIAGRNAINGAYVSITVAPTTAKITLNGEEYHVGTHKIERGKYDVKVEADGFKSKEFSIDVKDGKTAAISTYLVHEIEGLKYYERSAAEMETLKFVEHSEPGELKSFLEEYDKKIGIKYILPLDASSGGSEAVIQNGSGHEKCDMAFCLVVSGKTIDAAKVRAVIANKGYNASDYKIIFDKEDN